MEELENRSEVAPSAKADNCTAANSSLHNCAASCDFIARRGPCK